MNMVMTVIIWLAGLLGLAVVFFTVLPLAPVGAWWVRVCDFPRVQLAVCGSVIVFALIVFCVARPHWIIACIAALVVLSVVWHAVRIAPFTQIWVREVPSANEANTSFRVLASNVQFDNDRYDDVNAMIRQYEPDILLLMETNEKWEAKLRPGLSDYPHEVSEIRGEGLGMWCLSRLPVVDAEIRHVVSERRPSVSARFELEDGRQIRFIGVHPEPPGLEEPDGERKDSRVRDAELIVIAREVAEDGAVPWVVAGDFNDVAWSRTTRMFKKISGLVDPRVGRGMYNTYHAQQRLLRYPIDHVFLSPGLELVNMVRLPDIGSDHFPILIDLHLPPPSQTDGPEPKPEDVDGEHVEEVVEEGKEDAEEKEKSPE